MATKQNSFRPYLTGAEISYILALINSQPEQTKTGIGLKNKLSVFAFKIKENLTEPAYTFVPKQSVAESLGFSETDTETLSDSEQYEFLCSLQNPTEEQIAKGRELEVKLFGSLVGGI